MIRFLPPLILLGLVSCATAQIRLSIPDIKIYPFEPRDEPVVLGKLVEDRLAGALEASGRFRIHRTSEIWRPESTGPVAHSDWILHATLEESAQGVFETTPPTALCEVHLQARIIRAEDGEIIYSRRHMGSAVGRSRADFARLTEEATRKAADGLAKDLIDLAAK